MRSAMIALTALAEARQAPVNDDTLLIYSRELQQFEPRDIEVALRQLACSPRAEFQSAFPDLGTVIARVEQVHKDRTRPAKFVPCGRCIDGMVYVDGHGNACDVSESPKREMRICVCKQEWRARSSQQAQSGHDDEA